MNRSENFWSRRRASVEAKAAAEAAVLEEETLAKEHAALEEKADDEILLELDLPAPETLGKGDDFSVFMSKIVPDRIRRRALKVLWRSNPTLANVDMLVDYGEDFTDAAMAVENLQTAYQVGKGMLKHVEEMARQAAERENPTEPDPELEPEEQIEESAPELVEEPETVLAEADDTVDEIEQQDYQPPAPRRMKFRIEDAA